MPKSADSRTVAAVFDPARLTLARQVAGLTKKELATALEKTPAAITQYEAGLTRPAAAVLDSCAEILSVPVGFFAAGRPRLPLDIGDAHFRSLRSARAGERLRALTLVELVWELTEQLSQHVRLPAVDLPALETADPGAAARQLREHWQLPSGPVPHMVRLLESRGVVVAYLDFSDSGRVDAFSTVTGSRPLVVLIADKGNSLRTRFSAAHELAHLILHAEAIPGDVTHERQADSFAAEFLMPADDIRDQLPTRVDLHAFLALQQRWGMSVSALLYRCRELGTLSEASYKRAMMHVSRLGWRTHEPGTATNIEQPALLRRAFDLASGRGVTVADLARALQVHPARIRALLGMPDDRPALTVVAPADTDHSLRNAGDDQ